jgi:hypothetical protein
MRSTVGIRSGLCYRPERDAELLSKCVAVKVACRRKKEKKDGIVGAELVTQPLTACGYKRWEILGYSMQPAWFGKRLTLHSLMKR